MAFYSDYVLANKPFGYWPLNDDPLATGFVGNQSLLNVNDGNVPLTVYRYTNNNPPVDSSLFSSFNDCIPVRGMGVGPKTVSWAPGQGATTYNSIYYSGNAHYRIGWDRNASNLNLGRQQLEFLMGGIPQAFPSGCVWACYPITHISGLTLWCLTVWFKPPFDNAACQSGSSRLFLTWDMQYYSTMWGVWNAATIIHQFPWLISAEGERAVLGYSNNTDPLFESAGTGMLRQPRRMFFEIQFTGTFSLVWTAIVDTMDSPLTTTSAVTFGSVEWGDRTYYPHDMYTNYYDLIPVLGPVAIANVSVYYNRLTPTEEYFTKSWEALNNLTTPTPPGSYSTHLNNQVSTTQYANRSPNCLTHQFDTVLCRGMSHRFFTELTSTSNGDGTSTIRLFLHTYSRYPVIMCHDFQLEDTIQVQGSTQSGLNGIWTVDSMDFTSISFIANGTFSDETSGLKILKRPPIGFGAWRKEYSGAFPQYFNFGSNRAVRLNDQSSSATQLTLINRSTQQASSVAWVRKNLKRSSPHYQADPEPSRIEWSIFGDALRFLFVVGYKQTPKPHSHIILFGTLDDWNDDETKWMLLGMNGSDIGNPGVNFLFMFPKVATLVSGLFTCQAQKTHKSDAVMIGLDETDNYRTLLGSADFGQHMYPIAVPLEQG